MVRPSGGIVKINVFKHRYDRSLQLYRSGMVHASLLLALLRLELPVGYSSLRLWVALSCCASPRGSINFIYAFREDAFSWSFQGRGLRASCSSSSSSCSETSAGGPVLSFPDLRSSGPNSPRHVHSCLVRLGVIVLAAAAAVVFSAPPMSSSSSLTWAWRWWNPG